MSFLTCAELSGCGCGRSKGVVVTESLHAHSVLARWLQTRQLNGGVIRHGAFECGHPWNWTVCQVSGRLDGCLELLKIFSSVADALDVEGGVGGVGQRADICRRDRRRH